MEITNEGGNIIIKMNSPIDAKKVVSVFDYARYLELTKGIDVPQDDIDKLMEEVNQSQREYAKQRYKL